MKSWRAIGVMSGSSLDGLDLAEVQFRIDEDNHNHLVWTLCKAVTAPWSESWQEALKSADQCMAESFWSIHVALGHEIGRVIRHHWGDALASMDFIASHGHTVFHRPEQGYTCQIGDGAAIAAECNLPVVYDFRAIDVALGGSGAPMAPLADQDLFGGYDMYVNLGGIANISHVQYGKRIAYDVCPCNQWLNTLANAMGYTMDAGGRLAAAGHRRPALNDYLESFPFYHEKPRRQSMSNQEIQSYLAPHSSLFSSVDGLATVTQHIVSHLRQAILQSGIDSGGTVLLTGGGAHNTYLVDSLRLALPQYRIVVPDSAIIDFKEAILVAYAGWCRWMNKYNFSSEWSSSGQNSIGGAICIHR